MRERYFKLLDFSFEKEMDLAYVQMRKLEETSKRGRTF